MIEYSRKIKPKYYHMSQSIPGALAMSKKDFDRAYKGVFTYDDGRPMSTAAARAEMEKELAQGHLMIKSVGCDNFDPVHGCMGHERKDPDDKN